MLRLCFAVLTFFVCLAVETVLPASASAAVAPPYGWPEFLRTSAHSSDSPSQGLQASTASTIGINWMSPIHSPDLGSPVVAYNSALKKTVAYVGDDNGDVIAFDETTGATLWSTSVGFGDSERATPAVGPDGSVWVATSYNPRLYALNGATGAVECSAALMLTIDASPQFGTPPGGVPMVFVASIDSQTIPGPVYGIRQTDCKILWSFTNYGHLDGAWATPAYGTDATGKGRVYVGDADPGAAMFALDARTGKLVWTYSPAFPAGDYDFGAAATISPPGANGFADGVLYAPSTYGVLYAIDLTTGQFVWSYTFDPTHGATGSGRSSAALDGKTLVFGAADGAEAIDAASGSLLWHYVDPAKIEAISSPAIVGPPGDKIAVFGDLAGAVHVLRLRDGADLYDFQTLNYITSSPAIADGHVLIDSADGFLYNFKTGGAVSGAPTTTIASPTNGSSVPNPAGSLAVTGSASDSVGLQAVSVAVQAGGPDGSWYDATTRKWVGGPVDNLVTVASPGQLQSSWSFAFPVPSAGSTYRLIANAVDANHVVDRTGATSAFTVLPNQNAPQLTVSSAYVAPGNATAASATGFAPNETIEFTLQGKTVARAAADSSGSAANVKIHVAATDAFGPSALTATGQTSHRSTSTLLEIANAWSQTGYSPTQTNFEPNDQVFWRTLEPANGFLSRYWTYDTGAPVDASPSVVAGTAYVANDGGIVAAIDTATGAPIWTYATPSGAAVHGSPAISGNTALFGADDGTLYSVAASNGTFVGADALDGIPTAPVVVDSIAYVATDNGSVYAIVVQTGQILWQTTVPAAVTLAPSVDAARALVFVGDAGGNVTILDSTTGAVVGSLSTGGAAVTVAPIVSGNSILVASADGVVRDFAEKTDALKWSFAAPAAIGGLTADGARVSVGSADGTLSLLTQSNGTLVFATQWGSPIVGVSSAYNITFGETASGAVFGRKDFDPVDRVRWTYQTAAALTTTPTLVDGAVFAGAEDGGLYAFTFYNQPPQDERQRRENARLRKAAKTPRRWTLARSFDSRPVTAHAFAPFGPRFYPLHVDRPRTAASGAIRYHGGPQQRNPRRYAIVWGADVKTQRAGAAALTALRARGNLAGVVVDATAPPRYFDDAAVQREISRAIERNGWTAGIGSRFIVLTPAGPARGACAYHSAFELRGSPRAPVVYGVVQTGQTAPCGGLAAVTSREEAELGSDPLLDGWHDLAGNERAR